MAANTKVPTNVMPTSALAIIDKVNAIRAELADFYLERDELIRIYFIALLAKQHVVVYGPPGTGKSDLTRAVGNHIDDAVFFLKLMTKTTVPDETEGAIDVPLMMSTGEYRRRRKGKLTACHVAFLDEVFKASSMILNTMLMTMNEKEYEEEGTLHPVPLISLFGASNELPESKELVAFADRFVFKYETQYLTPSNRAKLHRRPIGAKYAAQTFISLAELAELQALVPQVTFSDSVNKQYDKILASADAAGLPLSDRAVMQAKRLMAASAILDGRMAANDDDLEVLEHALWRNPKDKVAVAQLLLAVVNPLKARAKELLDEATVIYDGIKVLFDKPSTAQGKAQAMDANSKLSNLLTTINDEIAKSTGNTGPLEKAKERVELYTENAVFWMMGKTDRMHEV